MQDFRVKILTPNKPIADVAAASVMLPSKLGYIEILPNHTALISELDAGRLVLKKSQGDVLRYFVSGGYVQVVENQVVVLADVVETAMEIDRPRAEEAQKRASERLVKRDERINLGRALQALKRARQRIEFLDTLPR